MRESKNPEREQSRITEDNGMGTHSQGTELGPHKETFPRYKGGGNRYLSGLQGTYAVDYICLLSPRPLGSQNLL